MSEPTLTITYTDLVTALCLEAGYPTASASRSTAQNDSITRVMKGALRKAYFPGRASVGGREIAPFEWSWLKEPTQTIALWPTQAPTSGYTLTSNGASPSVLTATGSSAFYASMVGKTITIYSDDGLDTVIGTGVVAAVSGSTLTLVSGVIAAATYRWGMTADGNYRWEDTFGGLTGECIALDDGNPPDLDIVSTAAVISARNRSDATGRPVAAAVAPKRDGTTGAQRFELWVWPTPSVLYTATARVLLLQNVLSDTLLYHAGGEPYSQYFLACVLAEVESKVNDGSGSMRAQEAEQALSIAAGFDLNRGPDVLGHRSNPMTMTRDQWRRWNPRPTTYNVVG